MHLRRCRFAVTVFALGAAVLACGEADSVTVFGKAIVPLPVETTAPLTPAQYASVHEAALLPTRNAWSETMVTLAAQGDDFTLLSLASLAPDALTPDQRAQLAATRIAIETRLAAAGPDGFRRRIAGHLERAAWADLVCHPLERTLPDWARLTIAAHLAEPGVRAEVERLAASYTPAGEDQVGYGTLTVRVRTFAGDILTLRR